MSHGSMKSLLAVGFAVLMFTACKKKEEPAVIEEVPATAAVTETDTTATLAEEPSLQQVGKQAKPGSAKAVFHPSAAADQAGFSEAGRFVVQVSVFKSKRQAAKLVEKLASAGYPAYVSEVENPTPELSGTWHRVRIGNFMRISDARAFGDNTLSSQGYQYWIDNKKNDGVAVEGAAYGTDSYSAPADEPKPARAARRSKHSEPAAAPEPAAYEPATPSEPSVPAGESWGTPKTEEPAAPASESWGNQRNEEPAATMKTAPTPEPASKSSPSATPSTAPADTGKVNLDEW